MRAAAVAVLVLLLGAVALALTSSAPRLAGTNDLRAGLGLAVPPGQELCQGPEFVPGDAARLRLVAHTGEPAGPPLAAELRDGGRVVASGEVRGGYGGGVVIALSPATESQVVDSVCIRNRGREAVALGGQALPPEQAASVGDAPAAGRVRLEYVRAGEESWYELAPTVVHRFGFGKASWLGSWTLYLAAALVLLSWLAALRLIAGGRRS